MTQMWLPGRFDGQLIKSIINRVLLAPVGEEEAVMESTPSKDLSDHLDLAS